MTDREVINHGKVCPDCGSDEWHVRGSIKCESRELANLRRAHEAFRLVTDWTKGNKFRAITGPHWNYCDFEMFVRDPLGSVIELQVNEASAMACYVTAAKHLDLLPATDETKETP